MEKENLFKEVIKDLVLKYIEKDDLPGLLRVFKDQEIASGLSQYRKDELDFGWPDFLQPYLEKFYNEIINLEGKCKSSEKFRLYSRTNLLEVICTKANLYASYGYLKGKITDALGKLKITEYD